MESDGGIGFNVTQEHPPREVDLSISGVAAACKGNWAIHLGKNAVEEPQEEQLEELSANSVSVKINKTSALADLGLDYNEDGVPS